MKRTGYGISCLFAMLFCISGCSSFLTYIGPMQHETTEGDMFVGDFVEYDYKVTGENGRLHFMKTAMCEKIVEKVRVSKKQRRGVGLALLELPFFGLGLFDMMRSYAIVEESRKVEPLGRVETGEQVECNGPQPAANEVFIIRYDVRQLNISAETDAEGRMDLEAVLPVNFGPADFEIYPEADLSQEMNYTYLPPDPGGN